MTQHPRLLAPGTLRGKTLRNRIVFGAHTNNMAEGGLPLARQGAYWLERALGGAGMIVTEPVPAHRTGVLTPGYLAPESDAAIPHFQAITEKVKAAGAVLPQQNRSEPPRVGTSGQPPMLATHVTHNQQRSHTPPS